MTATRPYRGSSAEARRLERRARLLAAARQVYGIEGFRAATVKCVCEKAGLTERYFYESFPNSAALFLALYKAVKTEAIAQYRQARDAAGSDPVDRLRAVLVAYYSRFPKDPAGARLSLIEAPSVSPELKEIWKACRDELGEVLADCWLDRQTPCPPALQVAVASAVRQIGIDWIEDGFPQPQDAVVETALQVALVLATGWAEPR